MEEEEERGRREIRRKEKRGGRGYGGDKGAQITGDAGKGRLHPWTQGRMAAASLAASLTLYTQVLPAMCTNIAHTSQGCKNLNQKYSTMRNRLIY
jgi:hypothetical protein